MASKQTTSTNGLNRIDQSMFRKRLTIRDLYEAINLGRILNKTTFFYGGAGLGKSEAVAQVADRMFPHRIGNNLCDVRLSDKEPQDIPGIPIPVEVEPGQYRTLYATPDFWPTDPNWEGIVFLDELPNAIQSTQHGAYQVVLDHIAGQFKFPKGCVFVGAGNRDTDNGATTELLGPLVNRMIVYEVDYDLDVWIEDYAVYNDIEPELIGFLKNNPDFFYTGDVSDRTTAVFASPRQWKTVSGILKQFKLKKLSEYMAECSIAGSVGEGLDDLVMAYYIRASKLPQLEDIFTGRTKDFKLERHEVDLLYVLTQSSMRQIKNDIMDSQYSDDELLERLSNFLNFMERNFTRDNSDTVMALTISLFSAPAGKEPVLQMNPKRDRLGPKLRRTAPSIMTLVMKYHEEYGQGMACF